jgi:hypothetical protein
LTNRNLLYRGRLGAHPAAPAVSSPTACAIGIELSLSVRRHVIDDQDVRSLGIIDFLEAFGTEVTINSGNYTLIHQPILGRRPLGPGVGFEAGKVGCVVVVGCHLLREHAHRNQQRHRRK